MNQRRIQLQVCGKLTARIQHHLLNSRAFPDLLPLNRRPSFPGDGHLLCESNRSTGHWPDEICVLRVSPIITLFFSTGSATRLPFWKFSDRDHTTISNDVRTMLGNMTNEANLLVVPRYAKRITHPGLTSTA